MVLSFDPISITFRRDGIVDFLKQWFGQSPAYVVFLAAYMDSLFIVGLFVYGTLLFGVGLVLLAAGEIDLEFILFLSFLGAFLGDQTGFWLGRGLGVVVLDRSKSDRIRRGMAKARELFYKFGIYAIIAGRFFGPTRSTLPVLCGSSDVSFLRYLGVDVLACFVWVSVWGVVLHLVHTGLLVL